jgi:hypothetical protein
MKKVVKYTLTEDAHYKLDTLKGINFRCKLGYITKDGYVRIYKGFKHDGCTPKIKIFGKYLGTPDGWFDLNPKSKYFPYNKNWSVNSSRIHDFLARCHNEYGLDISRLTADNAFLEQMIVDKFPPRELYYNAVRELGDLYWK